MSEFLILWLSIMFGSMVATLLSYYVWRSSNRPDQPLWTVIIAISVFLFGGYFGKNLFYGPELPASIGAAVGFTILAVPGIWFGRFAARNHWHLGWTFLISFLLSLLLSLASPTVFVFVALFGGFPT